MRRLWWAAVIGGVVMAGLAPRADQQGTAPPAQSAGEQAGATLPAGAMLDLRLQTPLDTSTAKADQKFDAATLGDFTKDGRVVVPAASGVKGFVSSVAAANAVQRGRLTLSFETLRIVSQDFKLRATVDQVFSGEGTAENARLTADATVGAAMTRVPGALQIVLTGVTVDQGGSIVSTSGADVKLPVGTILRVRVDRAVRISGTR